MLHKWYIFTLGIFSALRVTPWELQGSFCHFFQVLCSNGASSVGTLTYLLKMPTSNLTYLAILTPLIFFYLLSITFIIYIIKYFMMFIFWLLPLESKLQKDSNFNFFKNTSPVPRIGWQYIIFLIDICWMNWKKNLHMFSNLKRVI